MLSDGTVEGVDFWKREDTRTRGLQSLNTIITAQRVLQAPFLPMLMPFFSSMWGRTVLEASLWTLVPHLELLIPLSLQN